MTSESGTVASLFSMGAGSSGPRLSESGSVALQSKSRDVVEAMEAVEGHLLSLLCHMIENNTFRAKYDLASPKPGEPYLYALTTLTDPYRFVIEAFPAIKKPTADMLTKGPEEFVFHEVFEAAIERYTESRSKPNSALQETRSKYFCYPVAITVEAVPLDKARKPSRLLLLREFQILVCLWEQYRVELRHKQCNPDQMIGFPMPFEYGCIPGTEYDIPEKSFATYNYYGTNGIITDLATPLKTPLTSSSVVSSTLSYMTTEKLGPSVSYLMDMLRSQTRLFSLSSALMLYDQLICRLIIMHKYGVVHGDLNTDCLRFGCGNACNVLYISDFSSCVQVPSKTMSLKFHDRFVSSQRLRSKEYHFTHDLESAYYIFLLLGFGYLPWDGKVRWDPRASQPLLVDPIRRDSNPMVDASLTGKEKESFWESPSTIKRLINSREFELEGDLYHNFTEDLVLTLHAKMKDALQHCSRLGQETFLRDINVQGTAVNNAYFGLRKSIVSYFRFEALSASLRDPASEVKIGMLRSHDPQDRRVAWDLSSWCWNSFGMDTKPSGLTGYLYKAINAQRTFT